MGLSVNWFLSSYFLWSRILGHLVTSSLGVLIIFCISVSICCYDVKMMWNSILDNLRHAIWFIWQVKVEEMNDHLTKKKAQIAVMMERTSEVRRLKDELQQSLSLVFWKMHISLFYDVNMDTSLYIRRPMEDNLINTIVPCLSVADVHLMFFCSLFFIFQVSLFFTYLFPFGICKVVNLASECSDLWHVATWNDRIMLTFTPVCQFLLLYWPFGFFVVFMILYWKLFRHSRSCHLLQWGSLFWSSYFIHGSLNPLFLGFSTTMSWCLIYVCSVGYKREAWARRRTWPQNKPDSEDGEAS